MLELPFSGILIKLHRVFIIIMNNYYCFWSFQMEVEEVKQHEGIQQYYITKIEALQVYATKYTYLISFWLYRVFTLLCTLRHPAGSVG